jgi:hypothetical protein
VLVQAAGLEHPGQHAARYGARLGLDTLFVAAGIFAATRKPRSHDPAKAHHGLVSRMVADPAPLSAFAVGLLVFAPGVTAAGLLMEPEDYNRGSLAEAVGHCGPHQLQHLLSRAVWDDQQVLDAAAAWAVARLDDGTRSW